MSILRDFRDMFHNGSRGTGKTSVLIDVLRNNPDAIMLVHAAHFGDRLSEQYNIHRSRFISVRNGRSAFYGRQFIGPVVIDFSAVADILDQVQTERNNEEEEVQKLRSENKKLQEEVNKLKGFNKTLRSVANALVNKLSNILDSLDFDDVLIQLAGTEE